MRSRHFDQAFSFLDAQEMIHRGITDRVGLSIGPVEFDQIHLGSFSQAVMQP